MTTSAQTPDVTGRMSQSFLPVTHTTPGALKCYKVSSSERPVVLLGAGHSLKKVS